MSSFFETLEPRRLLASFLVTTLDDSGPGSLRLAIGMAEMSPGADVIEFDASLTGTITLGGSPLSINDDLTILGPGAGTLSINANNASRHFGVFNDAVVSISGLTLTRGSEFDGGSIFNSGTLSIANTVFIENNASSSGGAIFNEGTLTITNSTLQENTAGISGGGISSIGSLTILSSTISNNTANASSGGGIETSGTLTLTNSTISGNTAQNFGGGIRAIGTSHTISNSTIYGNTALAEGGGLSITGPTTMRSTIVAANTGGDIGGTLDAGSTNNLVQDATTAGGLTTGVANNFVGLDPQLDPLAFNGGPTRTHALAAGSPAIGVGLNPLALTTDQRGSRFVRGNSVDIGAYQRQSLRLTVDTLGDVDDGDYSAGNLTLREALALANINPVADQITFNSSLRNETITLAGTELAVLDDVTIGGLGAGLLTLDAAGTSRVFSIDTGVVATINGLTITGGNPGAGQSGGGILNRGTLTLASVTLSGNESSGNGGGAVHSEGTLTLTNTIVNGNTSLAAGGGIAATGTLEVSGSTISNNTSANSGAGITFADGTLTITGSTISANTTTSAGGGVFFGDGTLIVTDSTISDNAATDGAGIHAGGVIQISNSTFSGNIVAAVLGGGGGLFSTATGTIHNSVFTQNQAHYGGGISSGNTLTITDSVISANQANFGAGIVGSTTLTITGSTVTGNTASTSGGGVYNLGTMTIANTTIGTNSAPSGGGGILNVGTLNLSNSTVAQNTAGQPGGGIRDEGGLLTMRSSIVAGNTGGDIHGTLQADSTNNLVQDAASAGGLSNGVDGNLVGIDPRLGVINDTIGLPQFFPLLAGSPAIGMGLNPLALTTDQRGEPRVQGSRIDIGSFEASVPPQPSGTANSENAHSVVSVDPNGNILVFRQGWTFENLQNKTSAPAATGAAAIWVDPKDGLTYVAAPTEDGLLLFSRSAQGTWTFRNLTTETSATSTPARDLTHFISIRQRIVVIAGITQDGRVVAFQQTLATTPGGGPEFRFVDISADLEAQSQQTPDLASLTSYVPRWDTWHLAGVDAQGRIQSIWINTNNPNFIRWRTDNLSAITGAPAIAGQLTVALTSWGGINLTGLDTNGNMLTTWWVPRFGGQWAISNLTTLYNGPKLIGGNITAYTTPWGGINYVGLDVTGTVRVYWWVPSFGGQWAISRLLPQGTPQESVPTGALTSSSSTAGTLNVYGLNADGNVLRMSWQPGGVNIWNIEDLTEIAIEQ
jgi:predicted outer membrane repeat protein